MKLRRIDGLEISFSRIIEERVLIDEVSEVLGFDKREFWNFDWDGEPEENYSIYISYNVSEKDNYPVLLSLIFNELIEVNYFYELDLGVKLSGRLNCNVIVIDLSSSGGYLEIFPSENINKCVEGEDKNGNTVYNIPTEKNLSYDQIKSMIHNYNQE